MSRKNNHIIRRALQPHTGLEFVWANVCMASTLTREIGPNAFLALERGQRRRAKRPISLAPVSACAYARGQS